MISLYYQYAIISHYQYFTIIRDYFYDNFFDNVSDYSCMAPADYTRLFFDYLRLFHGVGTRKMGKCRLHFLTLSRRNDGLVSMTNTCPSASTVRHADRMESCLMERSCQCTLVFYYTHYLSWLNRIVGSVSTSKSYTLC